MISSTLSTLRPTDDVIIESTEISGMDAFEELLNTEDVSRLANPFKDTLVPILRRPRLRNQLAKAAIGYPEGQRLAASQAPHGCPFGTLLLVRIYDSRMSTDAWRAEH